MKTMCSLSVFIWFTGVFVGSCSDLQAEKPSNGAHKSDSLHSMADDWANEGLTPTKRLKRKNAVATAVGDIPRVHVHQDSVASTNQSSSKTKDSVAAPAAGPAGPGGPGGPGGPAPGPAPAPGPVPAPAPLTWDEKMAKMKKDMSKKVGSNFDADYVIDRPTQFPIKHKEHQPGPYYDIFPDDGSLHPGPGPAPAPPGQGPSPAPMGYIPFSESDLPDEVEHNDKVTMVKNWRQEYGPHGPEKHPAVNGPYIDRPFVGWSVGPPPPPPPKPWFLKRDIFRSKN